MKKLRISTVIALMAVASGSLASCGKKGDPNAVNFWSSFGATYRRALDEVVAGVSEKTGITIVHESQGSYPEIKKNLINTIPDLKYPNIAMGYPDHFAEYLGADILMPLDEYIDEATKEDYYEEYLKENYFYDIFGEKHLYALPFNKSTELLGYNGTFVEYCKQLEAAHPGEAAYEGIGIVPATWQAWAKIGPKYRAIYDDLIGKALFGKQAIDGTASDLVAEVKTTKTNENGELVDASGTRKLLVDFTDVNREKSRIISWDATDNAFITLIKQWGAKYTELPEDQKDESPFDRRGKLLFGNAANKPKVVECLSFFKALSDDKIFGIPAQLNGSFSSDAFATGNVLFMVCSSGGLSYNTKTWNSRFRVAPIPYYDDGAGTVRKLVISQGANICMTDQGNYDNCYKVIRELTSDEFQTEWCLNTGYYPCSVSAATSDAYLEFLAEATEDGIKDTMKKNPGMTHEDAEKLAYISPARVAYREGSILNQEIYMDKKADKPWDKFVDDAFIGSAAIRDVVSKAFEAVFESGDSIETVIGQLLSNKAIANHRNIDIEK